MIAFDCIAGPSDLISNNKNGVLIPLFDYDLFQEKLKLLMNDEKLREEFGANAREAIKDFSIDYIGEQFHNFIFYNK